MSLATRAVSEVTGPERIPELLNASMTQPVEVHLRSHLDVSIRTVTNADEPSILRGIYVRVPGCEWAEVAVEVADDLHRLGLATALLIRLAQVAESRQITSFFAEVLPENRDMLTVFGDGFGARTVGRCGEVDVLFATSSWRRAAQQGLER
jgi:GNAT superfamily N-acetyltransferase